MSNFVFVLDTNKQPIEPVAPGQARRLLKLAQATVYLRYPFTIILKYAASHPEKQPTQLNIDPGSKTTGLALVQGDKVLWGAELTHRGQQIKNDLVSRRAIRRNRRNRKTRYRKPRFLHRTREAWMVATQLRIQGKKHRDLGQPHPSICPNHRCVPWGGDDPPQTHS